MTKIVIVGAGSVVFTRNLLGDILAYPELKECTIALHDIDGDRLKTAHAVACWTAKKLGARPHIESSLERAQLLPGADFVLPLNAVTALLGAPIVIWVVLSSRNAGTLGA